MTNSKTLKQDKLKKNSNSQEKIKDDKYGFLKDVFKNELEKLPEEFRNILVKKEKNFKEFVSILEKKSNNKMIGVFLNPIIEMKNNMPTPNFEKLTLSFLLDDFERPIAEFDPKILLEKDFDKYLIEEKKQISSDEFEVIYRLKKDKDIVFEGSSISILRENCFDSNYDDLRKLGQSIIYIDKRGFISALKTIDIHRNMLLQKFEKYVVVYAGAGSWLRGEKSNDFDVFVVIDDTDVKRMPRAQVKDQLTKIIWQMSHEVAALTGIQIHIQVYLLTDFWDALKDAHPVMFTFLRDGVPFYDRGIYGAWKELLKLGKIRPSAEAIDMHMNIGSQLLDRAKGVFNEIVINDVYNAVLSPSQAILMLKGYNPTTPKETVKMFKEVLLAKEKSVTKKDVDILENTVSMFKKIEHEKDFKLKGKDVDKLILDAEKYLEKIKQMFNEISEEKTKESIISSYNELLNQIRTLPGLEEVDENKIFKKFEKEYIDVGKLPSFVKDSLKSFLKAKKDYDAGKVTVTEVNKVLKEARNIMSEIKDYRDRVILEELNSKKLILYYDDKKTLEIFKIEDDIYLSDLSNQNFYVLDEKNNIFNKISSKKFDEISNLKTVKFELDENLIKLIKRTLNTKNLYF